MLYHFAECPCALPFGVDVLDAGAERLSVRAKMSRPIGQAEEASGASKGLFTILAASDARDSGRFLASSSSVNSLSPSAVHWLSLKSLEIARHASLNPYQAARVDSQTRSAIR